MLKMVRELAGTKRRRTRRRKSITEMTRMIRPLKKEIISGLWRWIWMDYQLEERWTWRLTLAMKLWRKLWKRCSSSIHRGRSVRVLYVLSTIQITRMRGKFWIFNLIILNASYIILRLWHSKLISNVFLLFGSGGGKEQSMQPFKLLDGSAEFVLTYEDKEGDWMLVGDVPWGYVKIYYIHTQYIDDLL